MGWLTLVTSLPGQQSALRIRVWRGLKAAGAVPLRDGVYLAPSSPLLARALNEQRAEIVRAGGIAYVLPIARISAAVEATFVAMFDRSGDYGELRRSLDAFVDSLPHRTETEARRMLRQFKRDIAAIQAMDFFPGSAEAEIAGDLREAERALLRTFSPEEPSSSGAPVARRDPVDYRRRTWATRERLWVDRVASAWLIRRFIDTEARFVWLRRASDRPRAAIGFDFDGADFTHVEDRVTFEVIVASFGLDGDVGLQRVGAMVHALDVGGERVPEAAGFEAILTGARERAPNDDALLARVSPVLDDLYQAFGHSRVPHASPKM